MAQVGAEVARMRDMVDTVAVILQKKSWCSDYDLDQLQGIAKASYKPDMDKYDLYRAAANVIEKQNPGANESYCQMLPTRKRRFPGGGTGYRGKTPRFQPGGYQMPYSHGPPMQQYYLVSGPDYQSFYAARGRGVWMRGRRAFWGVRGRGAFWGISGGGFGEGSDVVGGGRSCYNCGQSGHLSRECPEPENELLGGGGDPRHCYECNQPGHIAKNCTVNGGTGAGIAFGGVDGSGGFGGGGSSGFGGSGNV